MAALHSLFDYFTPILDIEELEAQLKITRRPEVKAKIIDDLTSVYAYTDIQRAKTLLREQLLHLKRKPNAHLQLNFHVNSAFIENQFYNYTLAEEHLKRAVEIVKAQGDLTRQTEIYIDYAGICINLNNIEDAHHYLEEAEKHLDAYPDPILRGRVVVRKGYINIAYGESDEFTKAIELLLQAEQEITNATQHLTLKDYYFLTTIHTGLGHIYTRLVDLENSLKNYNRVLEICQITGMKTRLSYHFLNIGKCYIGLNEIDNAEKSFKEAIQIKDMISYEAQASAYGNLGYCYFLRNAYDEALKMYERAEHIYRNKVERNDNHFSFIEVWKAKLYTALNQRELAEKHYISAFEYARLAKNYQFLSEIAHNIAELYAQNGDFKNAYEYQVIHSNMKKRHNENMLTKRALELEVKYESEKRMQETKLLRLEKTSLQLKALRAQMNPHFMYNALNSIQNYITSKEVKDASKYLAKFAKLMRQSLDYSDLEIISLEKEKEFLEDYLYINQKLRFQDKLQYQITVAEEIEEDIMGVPTMIVQPYVENSIEHGLRTKDGGMVKIDFQLKDDYTILCTVEDNGVGRKRAREIKEKEKTYLNHRSKGTSITENRLRLLHNSRIVEKVFVFTIDLEDPHTKESLGTKVEILIPFKEIPVR
ncbi:MAG: histidine kinase [Bacteroidota bacterium]